MKITFDTNVLPVDDILAICSDKNWEFAVVTVTERELNGTDITVKLKPLDLVFETSVFGESKFGKSKFGSSITQENRHDILSIISGGTFPKDGKNLSPGQKRQLRDSMIFSAHIRDHRDIFVTNDFKAFIYQGRREQLQERFSSRIMTRNEFVEFCRSLKD